VPVVQVDNDMIGRVTGNAYSGNSVHVSSDTDARKTVDAARRLQPRARKVLLISGTSVTDRIDVEWFRKRLSGEPNLDIEVINNLSIPDLISLVSRLPRDVIVLTVSYFRDPEGNSYIPRDVLTQLAYASSAPVYAVSDTLIGRGFVGGHVTNWARTGELAADAAAQILGGKSPSEVVLKSPGSGVYMFDWRQLKRWGFSESDLPPGSVVKYRIPTAWEQYRWRIIGIGVLVIAQSLLIISLLIQRYRRRHAEESLRDMAGKLLQSQDDERRRIARDLHDGTGQHLSGIALSLGQVLADFPPGYGRLRQLLQDSHVASRQALNEVRAVSYALHPPILDGLRLVPALQWYLDGLQKRTSFSIDFEATADIVEAAPDAERALFRIVQESITNGLRHSGGSAIKVKLSNRARGIALEIEDNGHGIKTGELERVEGATSLGVGIAGMRERVRQLHGTFEISSSPQGTRVLVFLPIREKKYAAHSVGG
jgi:signal transduction histidine kinase